MKPNSTHYSNINPSYATQSRKLYSVALGVCAYIWGREPGDRTDSPDIRVSKHCGQLSLLCLSLPGGTAAHSQTATAESTDRAQDPHHLTQFCESQMGQCTAGRGVRGIKPRSPSSASQDWLPPPQL